MQYIHRYKRENNNKNDMLLIYSWILFSLDNNKCGSFQILAQVIRIVCSKMYVYVRVCCLYVNNHHLIILSMN